jgi:hypothetical protein
LKENNDIFFKEDSTLIELTITDSNHFFQETSDHLENLKIEYKEIERSLIESDKGFRSQRSFEVIQIASLQNESNEVK